MIYASRGLTSSEKNYPAAKLELLALKLTITEKLHDYLYGAKFTVLTDNNPLTYARFNAKLDSSIHTWLSSSALYYIYIVYRPGKPNIGADALSRYPGDSTDSILISQSCMCKYCITTFRNYMSCDMRFPTMWYVRPAKPHISLGIRSV